MISYLRSNDCFSATSNIECDVPQDSILGPVVFNINMIARFHKCKQNDIANYADDTTHFRVLLTFPLSFPTKAFNWFGNHHIKANPVQCDLLFKTKTPEVVSVDAIQIT